MIPKIGQQVAWLITIQLSYFLIKSWEYRAKRWRVWSCQHLGGKRAVLLLLVVKSWGQLKHISHPEPSVLHFKILPYVEITICWDCWMLIHNLLQQCSFDTSWSTNESWLFHLFPWNQEWRTHGKVDSLCKLFHQTFQAASCASVQHNRGQERWCSVLGLHLQWNCQAGQSTPCCCYLAIA